MTTLIIEHIPKNSFLRLVGQTLCTLYYTVSDNAYVRLGLGTRLAAPVDPAAMWRDVKSLIANEMAKMNKKIEGISQKLSSLEAKVLVLEADKETVAPKDPEDAVKRKRRTPLCLQVCYILPLMSVESTALSLYNTRFQFDRTEFIKL